MSFIKVDHSEQLAQHIAAALKDHPNAEVRVNPNVQAPIPPHIAKNICVLLQRVQVTGIESIAWAEAYQYVQSHIPPEPAQPGVPFSGLPTKE
jgi:hypothetical protein